MITLLTDFGTTDPYAGMMKGVIASVCPRAAVVDITHEIAPQDVAGAADILDYAHTCFPAGTIHVAVVDPGVGGQRAVIAVEAGDYTFLAPDNGLLGPVLERLAVKRAVRVENEAFFRHPVSRTFHGRDIFAPVAGHLAGGIDLDDLGPRIKADELIRLSLPVPEVADGRVAGVVVGIDRFGNLITNIDRDCIERAIIGSASGRIEVSIGGHRIFHLSETYAAAEPGELLALIGSRGRLEISVNQGSAQAFCDASRGDRVRVLPHPP